MQFEVLQHRQFGVERKPLGHIAHAPARLQVLRVRRFAEYADLPAAGRQQAGQHFHRRRLPTAVGADEAENLTAFDLETHLVDSDEIAERTGQIGRFDCVSALVEAPPRREHDPAVLHVPRFRQQGDEGLFQGLRSGARLEPGSGAGGDWPPGLHRDEPVEAFRLVHVGRGEEYAHSRTAHADALDQNPKLIARKRIDPGCRFIEDEEVRVVHQRAAQAELLLHSARELAGRPVAKRREAGGSEEFVDTLLALRLRVAAQAAEEVQVFEYRQARIQVPAQPLRHVGDPLAHDVAMTRIRHVASEHLDAAALDRPCSGDQRQQA
ncbi:hypothetical protein GALL_535350 [mine drainage metagenome]|uniref:Uncharacterized protein n=1 Tax=mine drainage metagenome TaxID=410659 RepID=A0A1J5P2M6_9ZZZZ